MIRDEMNLSWSSAPVLKTIENAIAAALPDAEVHVSDPQQDGQHFFVVVISPSFETMPLVRQHQRVLNALKDAFATQVHAVQLKTLTPTQWATEKSNSITA
ncbi:MAG: BolA/IbaG family iron-sulfur metabolism protein [Candidatus Margulisiibacteriota bacterium]